MFAVTVYQLSLNLVWKKLLHCKWPRTLNMKKFSLCLCGFYASIKRWKFNIQLPDRFHEPFFGEDDIHSSSWLKILMRSHFARVFAKSKRPLVIFWKDFSRKYSKLQSSSGSCFFDRGYATRFHARLFSPYICLLRWFTSPIHTSEYFFSIFTLWKRSYEILCMYSQVYSNSNSLAPYDYDWVVQWMCVYTV